MSNETLLCVSINVILFVRGRTVFISLCCACAENENSCFGWFYVTRTRYAVGCAKK